MANPQKENGYTPINHESMEKLLQYDFPQHNCGNPLKLVLFVIRKTWGYSKKEDTISLTQFEKGCNMSRPTVVHWLDYLVKAHLLVKGVKPLKNGYTYAFNKDWEQWLPLVKVLKLVKARPFTSKGALTKTSKGALTHKRKKKYTKEILSANADEEYSFDKQIKKMFESKDRRMAIIAYYWTIKKISYQNKETYQAGLKRELRPASLLTGYTNEQIKKTCQWLQDNADFKFTLETVHKYIDENLDKMGQGGKPLTEEDLINKISEKYAR